MLSEVGTKINFAELKARGISTEQIETQLENFRKGFPFMPLTAAATPNKGILQLEEKELDQYIQYFEQEASEKSLLKFVPASGAASRMFKELFDFAQNPSEGHKALELLRNYKQLAFAQDIEEFLEEENIDSNKLSIENYADIASFILEADGLNYGHLPKGLIKFHKYNGNSRTAFEEHLVEAANYVKTGDAARIHFTVSPEHEDEIRGHIDDVLPKYEQAFGIKYDINYSTQKPSTDTIAVDLDNEPFLEDGKPLFRPGGHGALIENLNEVEGDVVFIKNIDNVVPDRLKDNTYQYKKALGGYLLSLQEKAFSFLKQLSTGNVSEEELKTIENFCQVLGIKAPAGADKKEYFLSALNRPIRVCGMVKNEGEPGGGPFWVKEHDGTNSLQIVESSQIDMDNEAQKAIVAEATHFNPVDLICGIKDFEGNPFNLKDFVNPETGFISQKSKNGRDLKAQELPGLWNGAMHNWITLFVEVPVITFNPVKTVNDLLREQHQN